MDSIVDDFAARKPSGLEEVYAQWSRLFVGVARHVLADESRAEDCVHDALLRVWRAPNRFEGNRAMLRGYLVASVRNEAMSMLRSQLRRSTRETKAFHLIPAASDDPPIADPVDAARVRAALARLPQEQRTALELAYYGNKTHVEIAQHLGVPLGTVKSRISLAMRKLHGDLAGIEETAT